jgi:uncharacterized protein (TIGR02147 family)
VASFDWIPAVGVRDSARTSVITRTGVAVPAPSVYAYLDYRAFLRAWMEHRKREDPTYSYATFARAGGGSKAALANVLTGARTPRPETLDSFANAMGLLSGERNYLGLLVDLASAPDVTTRRAVLDRILATERYHQMRQAEKEPPADLERYLEFWYIPVIREMARMPGFRADPAWICRQLDPPIREAEAADALTRLLELGLLVLADDGTVTLRELRFRTPPETSRDAVMRFQREVLPDLIRNIDPDRPAGRHLLTSTILIETRQIPEAKAILNAANEQLLTLADANRPTTDAQVFQVSFQLLPMTDTLN